MMIWLGTILSFLRNNQETLLPYHECSRRNDMTQRLKIVPSSVAYYQAACAASYHYAGFTHGTAAKFLDYYAGMRVQFLAISAQKIATFRFPSVLVHDVTTEESSFKQEKYLNSLVIFLRKMLMVLSDSMIYAKLC